MGTRVCSGICVRSRAGVDDAATRTCASAARSLRTTIDGTRTGVVYRYMMHPCARARVRAIGRPRIRADTCKRVLSAWTAGGSARRRSSRRRRSTRTSARGTPPRPPRCYGYAPAFRPGRRATAGGTRSAGCSMRRGPLCAAAPPMCLRVCARKCVGTRMRGCARVQV